MSSSDFNYLLMDVTAIFYHMRDNDPVANAAAALLRSARPTPGTGLAGAWADERRAARAALRVALAAARLEPAAALEFIDACSGCDYTTSPGLNFSLGGEPGGVPGGEPGGVPGGELGGELGAAVDKIKEAAAADAVALQLALGAGAGPRQLDCDLVALAAGPLDDGHDGAAMSAAAPWLAGARPAVVAAVAEARAAVDTADAVDNGASDYRTVAARTETIVGLLSIADIALGGASLERVAATAFIGDGDAAAAAAFALVRRGDAPAQLALAATLAVALAIRGDPIVFGDFSVIAGAIAHKFYHATATATGIEL
jgi:hypothetical protein